MPPMPYELQITDLPDTSAIEVSSKDEASLAVVRDEVKLHGFEVGPLRSAADRHCFQVSSDEPGKAREFLMALSDVQVN